MIVIFKSALQFGPANYICSPIARVAQLVEHDLAKVGVAGSSPVSRSRMPSKPEGIVILSGLSPSPGGEMVYTRDLKSLGPKGPCGFKSRPGHYRSL